MLNKNIVLSFVCALLSVLMLFSSCRANSKGLSITSESELEQFETTMPETSDGNFDSEEETEPVQDSTDEIQTDENGVVIEIQRPVAGAPVGSTSNGNEEDDLSDETITEEDETEDLPYADEENVFVPYDVPLSIEDQMLVESIAARFNVHEELVFGIMWAESRYDKTALGRNNRYLGVMQVSVSNLPVLEKYFGIYNLMDFEQNVTAGCYYLGHYAVMFDHNMNIMLLYYHGGYKYANPLIEQGIFEDGYVREVLEEMNRIIEIRKQTAAEMGVKLKGWLYEY